MSESLRLGHNLDFSSCDIMVGFHKSSHIYGQVHVGFTIDNIVSMVTYPIRRNKLFKMHDRRSQK